MWAWDRKATQHYLCPQHCLVMLFDPDVVHQQDSRCACLLSELGFDNHNAAASNEFHFYFENDIEIEIDIKIDNEIEYGTGIASPRMDATGGSNRGKTTRERKMERISPEPAGRTGPGNSRANQRRVTEQQNVTVTAAATAVSSCVSVLQGQQPWQHTMEWHQRSLHSKEKR